MHNMDEAGQQYIKWNKPVIEGQILHASAYIRDLKQSISESQRGVVVARDQWQGKLGVTIQQAESFR